MIVKILRKLDSKILQIKLALVSDPQIDSIGAHNSNNNKYIESLCNITKKFVILTIWFTLLVCALFVFLAFLVAVCFARVDFCVLHEGRGFPICQRGYCQLQISHLLRI